MPRPKITNVLAASINGLIAGSSHEPDLKRKSYNLTNNEDQAHLAAVMATCDVIITGANSLRSESGLRTENGMHGCPPAWIIFTTKGIHKNHKFWSQTDIKRFLLSPSPVACFDKSVVNITCGEDSPVDCCLSWLAKNDYQHALLFGGGNINHMFYEKNVVDELNLTVSPVLFQSETSVNLLPSVLSPVDMKLLSKTSDLSGNVYLHYRIIKK